MNATEILSTTRALVFLRGAHEMPVTAAVICITDEH